MQKEGKLQENQQFKEGQYIIRVKDRKKQGEEEISVAQQRRQSAQTSSPKSLNEYLTKVPRNIFMGKQ